MSKNLKLIEAIKNKGKNLESEMSFFDHLEVLRWHIIRAVIAVTIFAILSFTFYDFVFKLVGLYFSELFFIRILLIIEKSTNGKDQQ
mgnify:CR=1 FL=1